MTLLQKAAEAEQRAMAARTVATQNQAFYDRVFQNWTEAPADSELEEALEGPCERARKAALESETTARLYETAAEQAAAEFVKHYLSEQTA